MLALIPARGGSKGIPRKNIKKIAGKPLIAWTIECALSSRYNLRVVVSTDSPKIATIAKKYGAEVPFLRPKYASTDTAPAIAVLKHALHSLNKQNKYIPKFVVYLQPTSPLRQTKQLDEAINIFLNNNQADTLVSVIRVPHNFHPYKLMIKKNKYLYPYHKKSLKKLDRHNLPILFGRNGPAILITKTNLIKKGMIYGKKILPYLMDEITSIDIDNLIDFELAEYFLNKINNKA